MRDCIVYLDDRNAIAFDNARPSCLCLGSEWKNEGNGMGEGPNKQNM
jgi:hypothetical protein